MLGALLLPLPVHAGGALVVHLHAIHADVALARLRIAGDHGRQRDEASAVFGPALQDGKIEQREVALLDDFLARAGGDFLGKELAHLGQHGQHLDLVEQTLRRLHIHEHLDAIGDLVERIDFKRQTHAPLGAELVDEDFRSGMSLDVFKQQRRAARAVLAARPPLGDAVGDLGDLQDRIDFRLDPLQLSRFIERGDPFPQVAIRQRLASCRCNFRQLTIIEGEEGFHHRDTEEGKVESNGGFPWVLVLRFAVTSSRLAVLESARTCAQYR